MDDPTLEEIHISLPPPVETLGPSGEAPLCGCGPAPGGGQKDPRLPVGDQVFPRC